MVLEALLLAQLWGAIPPPVPMDPDREAVKACIATDQFAHDPGVWHVAWSEPESHQPESIGMLVSVAFLTADLKDPHAVAILCTVSLDRSFEDLDWMLARVQQRHPKHTFITWRLNLPDRVVTKLPGKPAETKMRPIPFSRHFKTSYGLTIGSLRP